MRDRRSRHIVLSGCSGGGKSTLLAALGARGVRTVPEPGRRIVERALRGDGGTLPSDDLAGFAREAAALSRRDRLAHPTGLTVFDRSVVDAAVALRHATGEPLEATLRDDPPYDDPVFLVPPWPNIYRQDRERTHGLREAIEEYERLLKAYAALGYRTVILPQVPVRERVEQVLGELEASRKDTARP